MSHNAQQTNRRRLPRRTRSAFTLVELIVASVSASVLVAGLGSSIYIASRAFDDSDSITVRNLDASFAADEILTNLQFATSFSERSTTAVEFQVPDRDGDGSYETIRYAWSGSDGDPLTKSFNGSTPEVILDGVADLNLEYFTRTLVGVEAPVVFVSGVRFRAFEETRQVDAAESISISVPSGIESGDLLIAAVSVSGTVASNLEDPVPGWTLLGVDSYSDKIALGVWTRVATGSEPNEYEFEFGEAREAYGWMMRFTGQDTSSPISDIQMATGVSKFPSLPSASVQNANGLVLRLGAFNGKDINEDDPGVSNHSAITMDHAEKVSGGAAHKADVDTGTSGTAYFELKKRKEYVTATVVINPATEAP